MTDAIDPNRRRAQLAKVYALLLQQSSKRHLMKLRANESMSLPHTSAKPGKTVADKREWKK